MFSKMRLWLIHRLLGKDIAMIANCDVHDGRVRMKGGIYKSLQGCDIYRTRFDVMDDGSVKVMSISEPQSDPKEYGLA